MVRKGVAVLAVSLVLAGCAEGDRSGQSRHTGGSGAEDAARCTEGAKSPFYNPGGLERCGSTAQAAVNAVGQLAFHSTVVGGTAGSLINYAAGNYVDYETRGKHARATTQAAEDGREATWATEKGDKGSITVTGPQFADRSGRPCRPLKQDITVNGVHSSRDVTACKIADGMWVVTDFAPEKAD